jgi:glycosyltransferase involved in cell wall biosynthesis
LKVSVIIPVYNAEAFVKKAVHSALNQPECGEVILVEDASQDQSLKICSQLKNENSKIKLYTHPNRSNKGAGASRNLGMIKAKFEYLSFLDADDFYLPGFFTKAKLVFDKNSKIDFVFGTIGALYYDEKAKAMHLEDNERDHSGLSFQYYSKNNDLLHQLIKPGTGHLLLSGMLFKKQFLSIVGSFDESLIQSQDTDFIWRCAYYGMAGSIDYLTPVSIKGIHLGNRVFQTEIKTKFRHQLYSKWVDNIAEYKLSRAISILLFKKYLYTHPILMPIEKITILRIFLKTLIACSRLIKNPGILFQLIWQPNKEPIKRE